jgi:hypothetical protein
VELLLQVVNIGGYLALLRKLSPHLAVDHPTKDVDSLIHRLPVALNALY